MPGHSALTLVRAANVYLVNSIPHGRCTFLEVMFRSHHSRLSPVS